MCRAVLWCALCAAVRAVRARLAPSSQSAETTETILRDRHGAYQAEERRGNGFRRVVSGVRGVLRMTREAADAAVQRVRRFYFRDEG